MVQAIANRIVVHAQIDQGDTDRKFMQWMERSGVGKLIWNEKYTAKQHDEMIHIFCVITCYQYKGDPIH